MGKKKRKKKNKWKNKAKNSLIAALIVIITGLYNYFQEDIEYYLGLDIYKEETNSTSNSVDGIMKVHYLDIGQGDSIYISVNDYDILIDAGPKSDVNSLIAQLEGLNIDDFEIVIATHPHEDHIGGMTAVFENYDVEAFYMSSGTHTSATFENMITAVSNEGLKISSMKEGTYISLGDGAYIDVYYPMEDSYSNLNNYSPIMKLVYGDVSFMFTGDAESDAELETVSKYKSKLKSDVLKVGHHGSSTSSSDEFIDAVNPEYAIISCGENNSYGHPHKEILDLLNKDGIEYYRTDKQGQIIVTTDGSNIDIKTEK